MGNTSSNHLQVNSKGREPRNILPTTCFSSDPVSDLSCCRKVVSLVLWWSWFWGTFAVFCLRDMYLQGRNLGQSWKQKVTTNVPNFFKISPDLVELCILRTLFQLSFHTQKPKNLGDYIWFGIATSDDQRVPHIWLISYARNCPHPTCLLFQMWKGRKFQATREQKIPPFFVHHHQKVLAGKGDMGMFLGEMGLFLGGKPTKYGSKKKGPTGTVFSSDFAPFSVSISDLVGMSPFFSSWHFKVLSLGSFRDGSIHIFWESVCLDVFFGFFW